MTARFAEFPVSPVMRSFWASAVIRRSPITLLAARPLPPVALFMAAALAMAALVRRERQKENPLIPLDLLRSLPFRTSVIASVCCFSGVAAALVALPFYLQHETSNQRCDDRSLSYTVAADRGCGRPVRGPSHTSFFSRLPLDGGRRAPRGRFNGCCRVSAADAATAADSGEYAARTWLRPVSGTQ